MEQSNSKKSVVKYCIAWFIAGARTIGRRRYVELVAVTMSNRNLAKMSSGRADNLK